MSRFFNIIWGLELLDRQWTARLACGIWIHPRLHTAVGGAAVNAAPDGDEAPGVQEDEAAAYC